MDTLKGAALIGTLIGVLITFAMWVSLWENVWQASVEPTRGAIYETQLNRLGPSPCLRSSWMWWRMVDVATKSRRPVFNKGAGSRAHILIVWGSPWAGFDA